MEPSERGASGDDQRMKFSKVTVGGVGADPDRNGQVLRSIAAGHVRAADEERLERGRLIRRLGLRAEDATAGTDGTATSPGDS